MSRFGSGVTPPQPVEDEAKQDGKNRPAFMSSEFVMQWLKWLRQLPEARKASLKTKRSRRRFFRLRHIKMGKTRRRSITWGKVPGYTAIIALRAVNQVFTAETAKFDADSKRIRVDNCPLYSISNDLSDFIGTPVSIGKTVRGIGGSINDVKTGTIQWKIEDDEGQVHEIVLPGSLYIPSSPSKLLSPQHWAQVAQDNVPKQNGTHCTTYADRVVFTWGRNNIKGQSDWTQHEATSRPCTQHQDTRPTPHS
jgi:hypothetical protein